MNGLQVLITADEFLHRVDGVHAVAEVVHLVTTLRDGVVGVDTPAPPVDGCLEHIDAAGTGMSGDHDRDVLVGHVGFKTKPGFAPEVGAEHLVPGGRVVDQRGCLADRGPELGGQDRVAVRTAGGQVHAVVAQHIAGGEVRAGLAQACEQDPEAVGGHHVVTVDEGQELLGDVGHPNISGAARSAARPVDHLPAGVGIGIASADLGGVVGRAVVDEDDLGDLGLLGEQRVQAGRQKLPDVMARDNDTEPHLSDCNRGWGACGAGGSTRRRAYRRTKPEAQVSVSRISVCSARERPHR